MSTEYYTKEKLEKIIRRKIKNTNIVLDIGCGIKPQNFITPIVHICVEPFYQYAEKLQEIKASSSDRNFLIIRSTWDEVVELLPPNSVDTIFIMDVIEHLEKNIGEELLKKTEAIAKKQVIIFTPLGFVPQKSSNKKDAWGMDGGDWQEHKSGWTPDDFDDSWNMYVAKEYHFFDNENKKYEKPYGAFYAVKNKKIKEKFGSKLFKKYSLISNAFGNLLINKPIRLLDKILRKIYAKKI